MVSRIRQILVFLILILGVVLFMPVKTFAGSEEVRNDVIISISNVSQKEVNIYKHVCEKVNGRIHDEGIWHSEYYLVARYSKTFEGYSNLRVKAIDFLTCEDVGDNLVNITVNTTDLKKLSFIKRITVMRLTLYVISKDNDLSNTKKTYLYNKVGNADSSISRYIRSIGDDTKVDFAGAYEAVYKYIQRPISIFFGLAVILIFILLAFTLCFDLVYITLPATQLVFSGVADGKRSFFVSMEARMAVQQSEASNAREYVNIVGIYLRNKSKQLVALSLCIIYLVSGQIYKPMGDLINIVLRISQSLTS